MTNITTLASWEAESTSIPEIEAALADVRRAEIRAAVRTAVLTLVVVADAGDCAMFLETIREMAITHPAHAIVLVVGDDTGESRTDATVEVHALEREGASVCVEDLVLHVRGPMVHHLDSVVEPFTLADLPVAVWLPGMLTPLSDPLLGAADRIVVDSKELGDAGGLPDISELLRRFPVVDLSWVRLQPWREITAGLFEGDVFRPFVHGVRSATVWGKQGPRLLLGGWLASRLGLEPSAVSLVEDRHASIRLDCVDEASGHHGVFRVERQSTERLITTTVEVDGMEPQVRTLRLRDRSPGRVLGTALSHLGHDRVYEQAVAAALTLAPSPSGASAT
ncbi:MAG TPA: glucose-6-phosphate dehydrogenase assembly protein OpcA [Acidimicrobiales bacterium]|nr:glucose-6-phosphate dehydrogenase assembly protein OpcA [Acidimicrobiales bacterium]